ncbi:MAG: hypothetical protein QOG43_819 [Actinomycetota bacterium]|jgi:hypothetical protein|nr:hypothetical protein [Actinomycetota bacterium]
MRRPPAVAVIVVVAIVVAGALALTACSAGRRSNSAAPVPTTTLARTVSGTVDLRRLIVTTAPAGYDVLPSPPYGAVDMARLLAEFSDAPSDDRVILQDTRFKRGYTRGWQRESPAGYFGVFVFEFADEEGARSARDKFADQNVTRKDAVRFAVDSIADAVGESYTGPAGEGDGDGEARGPLRVHLVTFVRGPRLYQVGGQFADATAPPDETVAFAEAEARIAA